MTDTATKNHNPHEVVVASTSGSMEPYTFETVKFAPSVKIFFPPNPLDSVEERKKYIQEKILDVIRMTEDGPIKEFPASSPPTTSTEMKQTYTSGKHFSNTNNSALLFTPGQYTDCSFEIGYYVQMVGVGANAADVQFCTTGTETQTNTLVRQSGPFVPALNKNICNTPSYGAGLSLDTFWRCVENFTIDTNDGLLWAVSQAAPIRRVHIKNSGSGSTSTTNNAGSLFFSEGRGYASGGFVANCIVDGNIDYGTQQQFYTRNTKIGKQAVNGAWSLVFTDCTGPNLPPDGIDPKWNRATTIDQSVDGNNVNINNYRMRVEKPFIVLNQEKQEWELHVPKPLQGDDQPTLAYDTKTVTIRSFKNVKVIHPRIDSKDSMDENKYNTIDDIDYQITDTIQAALDAGKDVLICPGEYFLTSTLQINQSGQVILGLGLATLIAPQSLQPVGGGGGRVTPPNSSHSCCIRTKANVRGVRIAGLNLEASACGSTSITETTTNISDSTKIRSLLEVGEVGVEEDFTSELDRTNPIVLSDIFCRVGGTNLNRKVGTDVMIRIHSSYVIGDNLWLWRADHVQLRPGEEPNDKDLPLYHQIRNSQDCAVRNALIVNGNHVQMYGLFCEHTNEHQVIWNGDYGTTVFFQCELPYDATLPNFVENEYCGYYVNDQVTTHTGKGMGVYCNFTVDDVQVPRGIRYPTGGRTLKTDNEKKRRLNDDEQIHFVHPFTVYLNNKGGIKHIINDKGQPVESSGKPGAIVQHL